jgi:hypothetical protein
MQLESQDHLGTGAVLNCSTLCAAGAEAFAAQDRPPGLRLEWDGVLLAALIANDLEAFALAATASLPGSTKTLTAGVTARLATFRMA